MPAISEGYSRLVQEKKENRKKEEGRMKDLRMFVDTMTEAELNEQKLL